MIRTPGALCLGVAVLLLASSAEPNGGSLRLNRGQAGPYLVSVWIQPNDPRAGDAVDVSVAVMKPSTGAAVLDAATALRARRSDGAGVAAARLERGGGGNLLLYHGNLDVPDPGRWRVVVTVAGPDGNGEAAFDLDVAVARSWARPVIAGVGVAFAIGLASWLWYRRRARGTP